LWGITGIITKAQEARIAAEDAEFNEENQMILFQVAQMIDDGASDEEIEKYLKSAYSRLGEKVVIGKVGEDWLIVCDSRVITTALDSKELGNVFKPENIGTSSQWTVLYDEKGYLTIIGSAITSGELNIPQYITYEKEDGTEHIGIVKQIGASGCNVFSNRYGLTKVSIPEGVEKIYNYAFMECSGISEVNFPSTLKEIGDYEFYNCSDLSEEINFPNSLTTIGEYAFYKCSGLTGNIIQKLENSNIIKVGSYAFYGCNGLTGELKLFDNISMGAMTLAGCSKITGDINTLLVEGLTEIPDGAFSGMSGLTGTPNIPVTVTKIGDYAFYMCSGLTGTLTIPSICISIGEYAFYNCAGFNLLSLDTTSSGKLETIGDYAFAKCRGLVNDGLSFSETLKSFGAYAFCWDENITGILYIPNKITDIPVNCFYLTGVESIVFGKNVSFIGNYAFYGTGLKGELSIADSVVSLGTACFKRSKIEKLKIGNGMELIGVSAFEYCVQLSEVLLSDSVSTILNYGFKDCTNLSFKIVEYNEDGTVKSSKITTDVIEYLKKTKITSIQNGAFENCTNLMGTFYNKLTTKGGTCKLGSAIFNGTGVVVTVDLVDGLVLNTDGTTYSIKENAYTGVTSLTGKIDLGNITLEDESTAVITSIGGYAFYGCTGITEIVIPNTVTSIGVYSFYGCTSMTSIKLPENDNFTKLNTYVLGNCTSLKSITIPSSVQSYGSYVLSGSGIESLDIPSGPTCFGSSTSFRGLNYC
jgi:hypothetical protein